MDDLKSVRYSDWISRRRYSRRRCGCWLFLQVSVRFGEDTVIGCAAIVRRVVKEKISQCSDVGDMSLHKDALLAFSESTRIFIHYLSAMANDICKESKRQTMNADDVLKAIEEIDFPEFLGPLKATLEGKKRHREMIQSDSYQLLEYLVVA
ncbi:hypothetical protein QQ045_000006 [Rhodiola kirilowii]